ncbi:RNA polymerase ECF-subfamily sigma factor [Fimbriiglobus ruber]|uniref:RNA polymerase ECF-subfamily sigma factor n=2 Tax=Fimbriiglobus ruber TaxID=1908690 RepID=A0A225DXA8_9BACT|nr:RNA polymerase ECF-subfamily sigma factor [Fimbriiglobus ruber]
MDEHQEREIARGLRGGNPDAWRALYDAHAERVWRAVARLMGPSATDVADVVQETFLAAARSAAAFDPDRGTLWMWLWGIARVRIALHYRQEAQRDRLLRAGADHPHRRPGETRDALADGELNALVRATLTELPADYETLLTAKYMDGDSVETIASRERATAGAVRSKLARARQAFRDTFGKRTAGRPARTEP